MGFKGRHPTNMEYINRDNEEEFYGNCYPKDRQVGLWAHRNFRAPRRSGMQFKKEVNPTRSNHQATCGTKRSRAAKNSANHRSHLKKRGSTAKDLTGLVPIEGGKEFEFCNDTITGEERAQGWGFCQLEEERSKQTPRTTLADA